MRASDLDFSRVDNFSEGEFPTMEVDGDEVSVLHFLDAEVVHNLDKFRRLLGQPVSPNPVDEGWVREGGSEGSRHYIGQIRKEDGDLQPKRLSTAGDVFPDCDARLAFLTALGMSEFGGIGIYLDTNGPKGTPQPMLHLDLRSERTVWMRYDGEYIYPGNSQEQMDRFFRHLGEM